MGVNLSIKDVPDDVAERLRRRAARNHRSLQGELMAIVEQAARSEHSASLSPPTDTAAPALRGWKTVEQLMAERQAAGWVPDPAMAGLPRGVDLVRADRDSR
jgi:antitoxin FitA